MKQITALPKDPLFEINSLMAQRDRLEDHLRACIHSLDNARDQLGFISDSADKARHLVTCGANLKEQDK